MSCQLRLLFRLKKNLIWGSGIRSSWHTNICLLVRFSVGNFLLGHVDFWVEASEGFRHWTAQHQYHKKKLIRVRWRPLVSSWMLYTSVPKESSMPQPGRKCRSNRYNIINIDIMHLLIINTMHLLILTYCECACRKLWRILCFKKIETGCTWSLIGYSFQRRSALQLLVQSMEMHMQYW